MVKVRRFVGGNNNQIWVGWRKLEWSLLSALDSTRRKGWEEHMWGNNPSFSPHIVYCLQSLVQRNLNKGVGEGRFSHFFLQLSFSLGNDFLPPTFNLCSYRACKNLQEIGFNILAEGNLQGGGAIFWTTKVPTT